MVDRTGAQPESTQGSAYRPTAPWALRVAAGWSWRLLVLAASLYACVVVLARLRVLTLAVAAALLLAALLLPVTALLRRIRLPPALAALVTIVALLGVLALAGRFIWVRVSAQLDSLKERVTAGVEAVRDWLVDGPLALSQGQIDEVGTRLVNVIGGSASAEGVLGGALAALEVATGTVLTLFVLFFLLKDGERMWEWIVGLFNPRLRETVEGAGHRAWETLTYYVRGTVLIALVDAMFIGLALLLVGVPLVLPLVVLVFLGAFVPLIGAVVAGGAATLVALVTEGPISALLVLVAVIVVQQLEGNVLQPLIMKKALRIHPLPLAAAVTAGTVFAGVAGAVVAVPVLAVSYHVTAFLTSRDGDGETPAARSSPAEVPDDR